MDGLHEIPIDNGTTYITVATPDGWECWRKACPYDFKHTHSAYGNTKRKKP